MCEFSLPYIYITLIYLQKAALKQAKGAISETPIGYWNNSMAQGMMSLQQEMEAFGERMPERSRRSSNDESETSPHQG